MTYFDTTMKTFLKIIQIFTEPSGNHHRGFDIYAIPQKTEHLHCGGFTSNVVLNVGFNKQSQFKKKF